MNKIDHPTLFSQIPAQSLVNTPLAEKLRPKSIDEIVGQEKSIGKKSVFYSLLQKGSLPSLILWGPPGTGKTTFARLLADTVSAHFLNINAVESGTAAIRKVGNEAHQLRLEQNKSTILFVDEIHRFNKGQQDVLLPFVESGDFILIGATTENPSYELNKALMSRCHLLRFERLTPFDMHQLIIKACKHFQVEVSDWLLQESIDNICLQADGDGRKLYNQMELLGLVWQGGNKSLYPWPLSPEDLKKILSASSLPYDKKSDQHYDLISAFIKSIRGSDADAALYWMVRMLEGGEDPSFIARRLVILASEDIGNADPKALPLAVSGFQAVELIGLPEAAINLSQVVTYLATAPKSNASYMALHAAKEFVLKHSKSPPPAYLQSSYLAKSLGKEADYKYPHDYEKSWVQQKYLPDDINPEKTRFYSPKAIGFEKHIRDFLSWLKAK